MSMDCDYAKAQIDLTKRVVDIYRGKCDAPIYVTAFSAAWYSAIP